MSQTLCSYCGAINRLAPGRDPRRGRCGSCHQALFAGQPVALDDVRFARWLKHEQLPLVVDFWAAWCGPCRLMAPVFAQTAAALEPAARFAKVDVEAAPRTAQAYAVRSIPAILVFRGGRAVANRPGLTSAPELRAWLGEVLGPAAAATRSA